MADDLKQTGKPDDARINVDQDHELKYWSVTTQETLKKAAPQPMAKNKSKASGGSVGDRPSESISLNLKPAPAQNRRGYDLKKNAP